MCKAFRRHSPSALDRRRSFLSTQIFLSFSLSLETWGDPDKGIRDQPAVARRSDTPRDRLRKFIRHVEEVLALPTRISLIPPKRNAACPPTNRRISCTFNRAVAYCICYVEKKKKKKLPGEIALIEIRKWFFSICASMTVKNDSLQNGFCTV